MIDGMSARNSEALSQLSIAECSRPENIELRLGTHKGALQYALSKVAPERASRSRFGVMAAFCP